MLKAIQKLIVAKERLGFLQLLIHIYSYPKRKKFVKRYGNVVKLQVSNEEKFTLIWKNNIWSSKESKSGPGSTLKVTERFRQDLPRILDEFNIKSVFDGPCGDFHWMSKIDMSKVDYVGGDIVKDLIDQLNQKFASDKIRFIHHDLTRDAIPECDLVINRDCLFHFSYSDILKFFSKFLESEAKFLLTTSHDNFINFSNSDIITGDFRLLDLFAEPFSFPMDFLFKVPEPGDVDLPSRGVILWNRDQVIHSFNNLGSYLRGL